MRVPFYNAQIQIQGALKVLEWPIPLYMGIKSSLILGSYYKEKKSCLISSGTPPDPTLGVQIQREGKGPTCEYLLVPAYSPGHKGTRKWAPPPREGSHLNLMPIKGTDTGAFNQVGPLRGPLASTAQSNRPLRYLKGTRNKGTRKWAPSLPFPLYLDP